MSKTDKQKPVANILSLGGIAPEFDMPVSIPRVGADPARVVLRGRGMRKSEWLALRDQHLQEIKSAEQPVNDDDFSFVEFFFGKTQEAAALICKAVAGWELEDAFNVASLLDLEDRFPGSLPAILSAYDAALLHGRLGN